MKKKPTVPAAPAPPCHWSVEFGRSRGLQQRPFTPWLGHLPRFYLRGTRSHLRTREFSYEGRLKGWDRTLDRMIAICEANRFEEIHQYWDSPVNVPNEQHAWLFLDGGLEIYASPCLWPGMRPRASTCAASGRCAGCSASSACGRRGGSRASGRCRRAACSRSAWRSSARPSTSRRANRGWSRRRRASRRACRFRGGGR
ncbi:MAG: hypothetical protein M5U13_03970 [Thermoanaerobaculia bacterium]|nr:hypothetical protein [Thermoanaerobaculia bacterium]